MGENTVKAEATAVRVLCWLYVHGAPNVRSFHRRHIRQAYLLERHGQGNKFDYGMRTAIRLGWLETQRNRDDGIVLTDAGRAILIYLLEANLISAGSPGRPALN